LNTFFPSKELTSLVEHLKINGHLADLSNCDEIEESFLSSHVRDLLEKDDEKWKELVPETVKELIEKQKLFKSN